MTLVVTFYTDIYKMKFVHNFYTLIIILRSTWGVVQNAADFTLDELTHLSQKLNPEECMRLLEAIYAAIPKGERQKDISPRENPMNQLISNQVCLNELIAWSQQFPSKTFKELDGTEPEACVVMTLHLIAMGRTDLANYMCERHHSGKKNGQISKDRIFKRDTNDRRTDHRPRTRRITHGVKRESAVYGKSDHPIISGGVVTRRQSGPEKNQPRKPKLVNVSKGSLYLIIALGIVVLFICGIVFLIFRRSLRSSPCLGERSDLWPGKKITQEKGLQCIRCLNDQGVCETRSIAASQISEIDVEGGSCFNSLSSGSRKNFGDLVSCETDRGTTPGISVEELELFDENLETENQGEAPPESSCRCRPLEKKTGCTPKSVKKKKKTRCKAKKKEETKTKSYLKVMQEKILPRQRRQVEKESDFQIKHFQEKILAVLNQNRDTCRCCNCTPHWEIDSPKVSRSPRNEKRCVKREKMSCKGRQSKQHRCEKSSVTKGCDREAPTYQTSASSRSPTSSRRSAGRQESDWAQKSKLSKTKKSRRIEKVKDDRALSSASSSSGTDRSNTGNKNNSKRSKEKKASTNTLLTAHDKPKRFF